MPPILRWATQHACKPAPRLPTRIARIRWGGGLQLGALLEGADLQLRAVLLEDALVVVLWKGRGLVWRLRISAAMVRCEEELDLRERTWG